jgi:UDP-N-acetylmuramoylalanine-D-glutamate ligase
MDVTHYFKDKRVTVMRIGLLGRGVGDAAYLAEAGARVKVVDDAPQAVMQPSVDALSAYPSIEYAFGEYHTEDFTDTDLVLVGAGTPLDSPEFAATRKP